MVDQTVLRGLLHILDEVNSLVQKFQMAHDRFEEDKIVDLKILMKVFKLESGHENYISDSDDAICMIT